MVRQGKECRGERGMCGAYVVVTCARVARLCGALWRQV